MHNLHVALLTPPGRGAVAVLRAFGERASDVVNEAFASVAGRPLASFDWGRIVVGRWRESGEELVVCRRDASTVEIHCHGGSAAVEAILQTMQARGAQLRSSHEQECELLRDPLAAEAIDALAHAATRRTAAVLLDQQQGALRRAASQIADHLAAARLATALEGIEALLEFADFGLHLTKPWRVVLAGPPNVGKSSLINALLGYERSLVFDQPGTTRDVVQSATALEGWPVELSDTAGLRTANDELEFAGVRLAERQLDSSDLALLVFDDSAAWTANEANLVARWPNALLVHNKCDLLLPVAADAPVKLADRPAGLATSAKSGAGIAELMAAIVALLVPNAPPPGTAVPFTARHVESLRAARRSIELADLTTARSCLSRIGEASDKE